MRTYVCFLHTFQLVAESPVSNFAPSRSSGQGDPNRQTLTVRLTEFLAAVFVVVFVGYETISIPSTSLLTGVDGDLVNVGKPSRADRTRRSRKA